MANMTLSIPDDLYFKMRRHKHVRWSEIARAAIAEYLDRLEREVRDSVDTDSLRQMLEREGIDIERVPEEKAVRYYRKMRELEWRRISSIRAR